LKLERSINNLAKKLDRLYPEFSSDNNTGLSHWKGKPIIPLDKWIELSYTPHTLDYFPDDFDQVLTYTSENELEKGQERLKDIEKWNSDFADLMEHTKNRNYGKAKCFHCLPAPPPARDDPIFIGINRLVAKGLTDGEQQNGLIEYPCCIVNRFRCPYEGFNIRVDEDVGQGICW
jgi:hypothetical protein